MKRTFRFNKLVRDLIPGSMTEEGSDVKVRKLTDAEYIKVLKAKLLEEAAEVELGDGAEAIKELADLQEVIDCLAEALGSDKLVIAEQQAIKRVKAGSFKDGLYIETITIDDDVPWARHYINHPDRYPEVREDR